MILQGRGCGRRVRALTKSNVVVVNGRWPVLPSVPRLPQCHSLITSVTSLTAPLGQKSIFVPRFCVCVRLNTTRGLEIKSPY